MLWTNVKDEAKRLGANIRRIRTKEELSLDDLAKKLKVDKAYMSRLENGKKNPTLSTLTKLAEVLGVTIARLFK